MAAAGAAPSLPAASFEGRIVMVGCGSMRQAVLPVLERHLPGIRGRVAVLSAQERGRRIAESCGAGAVAAVLWAIRHPRRGVVEPESVDFEERPAMARPYLGHMTGAFTDWTPLEGRGVLFPEKLDVERPWQLQNIRSRQWSED